MVCNFVSFIQFTLINLVSGHSRQLSSVKNRINLNLSNYYYYSSVEKYQLSLMIARTSEKIRILENS